MQVSAHLDLELVAIDGDDTVTVLLDLQAPAAPETGEPRAEHTAVVVLDRSGSMGGLRLENAKRALIELVGRLDDRDRFGLVVFDHESRVAIPAGRVGDLGRDRLRDGIAAIQPGGSTDLSSGYLRGLQEARRVCGGTGATIVLLSDGLANAGVRDPEQLRQVAGKAAGQSITTSTIGIGRGYDETLLVAVAEGGLGNHAFAEHADAAAAAVMGEVEGLLAKTVQAASLVIAPTGDVDQVSLLNTGLPAQRVEGGVMVELGDFYGGELRKILLTLRVPAMAALGLAQVATITLTYVELPSLEQHTVAVPVSVNVVPSDIAARRVADPVVTRDRLLLATQAAKQEAEQALREGDIQASRRILAASRDVLAGAPPELADDELADEMAWLDRTEAMLDDRDRNYTLKRMSADRSRKIRGYRTRTQGGETAGSSDDPAGPGPAGE